MPTAYLHRLLIICPVARLTAVGAFWQASIDPADDGSTWPSLNVTGNLSDPETARWCSIALTEALLRPLVVKVCQLAAVTPPTVGTWSGWTRAQKQAWLASTRAALFSATGIWLDLSDGDGAWNDPEAALLAAGGLKRRQGVI